MIIILALVCILFAGFWLWLSEAHDDRQVAATQRCTSAVYVVGALVLCALSQL